MTAGDRLREAHMNMLCAGIDRKIDAGGEFSFDGYTFLISATGVLSLPVLYPAPEAGVKIMRGMIAKYGFAGAQMVLPLYVDPENRLVPPGHILAEPCVGVLDVSLDRVGCVFRRLFSGDPEWRAAVVGFSSDRNGYETADFIPGLPYIEGRVRQPVSPVKID